MSLKTFTTTSATQTRAFGAKLARELKDGEIIALVGHLGSGKTTFIKGLAKGLGVKDIVTSPTFVLMKIYKTNHKIIKQFVHVDCYRVPGSELAAIGLGDYLKQPDTVMAIEWAEKLSKKFRPSLTIIFKVGKQPDLRSIKIKSPKLRLFNISGGVRI